MNFVEEFVEPEEDYNETKKELREIFMMYDRKNIGYIPSADFKLILKELDNDLPDTEAEAIVKELDTDGSGTIDFEGKTFLFSFQETLLNLFTFFRIY